MHDGKFRLEIHRRIAINTPVKTGKGVFRWILAATAGFSVFLTSCGDDSSSIDSTSSRKSYPIEREIRDDRGRILEVRITGRSDKTVKFFRKPGLDKEYTFPIGSLSAEDQKFVRSLPVTFEGPRFDPDVQRHLDRFEDRAKEIGLELAKKNLTSLQRRHLERELDDLVNELIDLVRGEDLDLRDMRKWADDLVRKYTR